MINKRNTLKHFRKALTKFEIMIVIFNLFILGLMAYMDKLNPKYSLYLSFIALFIVLLEMLYFNITIRKETKSKEE